MFSIEVIILTLVAIVNAMIVWVIASQGWKSVVNRYFISSAFFVVFWAIGTTLFLIADNLELAEAGITLFYVAPMLVILFLSFFAVIFPRPKGTAFTSSNMILTIITVLFAFVIVYSPSLLTQSIVLNQHGLNELIVQPLGFSIYVLYFSSAFMLTFAEIFMRIRKYKGYQRKQLEYIFAGTFLAAVFSLITNLMMPLLGNSQFIWLGPTWTLFYIITVSVSIVKHQLFDIRLDAV